MGSQMAERLITIATFSQPIMAELARTRLEAESIGCFIADESIVMMNPFYSPAVGGVKLQVRESDIQRALEVLRQRSDAADSDSAEARAAI